jgi:hypothetical protein
MTPFETVLLILVAGAVGAFVFLVVRIARFLDRTDGTLSRLERETLPAIERLSSVLSRLDLITGEAEATYRSARERVNQWNVGRILELLGLIVLPKSPGGMPLALLWKAMGTGIRTFRKTWNVHKNAKDSADPKK